MDKKDIKILLREESLTEKQAPHLKHVTATAGNQDTEAKSNDYDKVVKLLNNDIFNHAAIVRQLKGEPWGGSSEATNRSLFRKKLKKMTNDEGGEYAFSEETLSDIQKILMGVSSTINHSLGRQGV
jgi:hypothetical protein